MALPSGVRRQTMGKLSVSDIIIEALTKKNRQFDLNFIEMCFSLRALWLISQQSLMVHDTKLLPLPMSTKITTPYDSPLELTTRVF